jgi:hypothetical protein
MADVLADVSADVLSGRLFPKDSFGIGGTLGVQPRQNETRIDHSPPDAAMRNETNRRTGRATGATTLH